MLSRRIAGLLAVSAALLTLVWLATSRSEPQRRAQNEPEPTLPAPAQREPVPEPPAQEPEAPAAPSDEIEADPYAGIDGGIGVDDVDLPRPAEPPAPSLHERFGKRFEDASAALVATLISAQPERSYLPEGPAIIVTRLSFRVERVLKTKNGARFAPGEIVTTSVPGGALPTGERGYSPHAYTPPTVGGRAVLMFGLTGVGGSAFLPTDNGALARIDAQGNVLWDGSSLEERTKREYLNAL